MSRKLTDQEIFEQLKERGETVKNFIEEFQVPIANDYYPSPSPSWDIYRLGGVKIEVAKNDTAYTKEASRLEGLNQEQLDMDLDSDYSYSIDLVQEAFLNWIAI